ncbi:MAG: hypothetical protein II393_02060, partial [Cytophagales bacterium]|nr:hypothetical protein [Cytophagales bacterium]
KTFDNYFTAFCKGLNNEQDSSIFTNGKIIFWLRKNFLIEQFMQQLKQNIKKLNNNDITEVIFHGNYMYCKETTRNIVVNKDNLCDFWLTNYTNIIRFYEE